MLVPLTANLNTATQMKKTYRIKTYLPGEQVWHSDDMTLEQVRQWVAKDPKATVTVSEWVDGEWVRDLRRGSY